MFPSTQTRWGRAQTEHTIAEGIIHYTTASHGGFGLSPARYAAMPAHLRACSWTGDRWFEEDCAWCAVVLAWPEYFDASTKAAAERTYQQCYATAGASHANPQ